MENKIFITTDIYIASTLSALDIQPEKVTFEFDGKRNIGSFIYIKNLKKIAQIIKNYFDHNLKIEPQKLFYSLKNLKTRLYSNQST